MDCGESYIAPLWAMYIAPLWTVTSTQRKQLIRATFYSEYDMVIVNKVYGDVRSLIYETKDNNMKRIQNVALYVLALNCGIIVYWFVQYKPIFDDFGRNHGAKNANGERNGQPRNQISICGWQIPGFAKFIGLNRFMILVLFLSKICIPFLDSITGKLNRHSVYDSRRRRTVLSLTRTPCLVFVRIFLSGVCPLS